MGTKRLNRQPFTEEQAAEIENDYKEHSLYWLSQKWDAYPDRIRKLLVQRGVKIRDYREGISRRTFVPPRRTVVNEHAFDNADNDDTASYFLGLLLTDGTVHRRNYRSGHVALTQAEDNKDIVYKFRDFVRGSGKVTEIPPDSPKHQLRHCFKISSIHMVNVLGTYGIVIQKTSNQTVDPRLVNNRHFWRGVFDGDGHLEVTPRVGLSFSNTSPHLFSEYERFVRLVTGTDNLIHEGVIDSGKVQRKLWANGDEAAALAVMLYTDHTVSIDRKQALADAIIASRL